jgi:hypothetical protein
MSYPEIFIPLRQTFLETARSYPEPNQVFHVNRFLGPETALLWWRSNRWVKVQAFFYAKFHVTNCFNIST